MRIGGLGPAANELISGIKQSYDSAAKKIEDSAPKVAVEVEERGTVSATAGSRESFGATIRDAVQQVNNLQSQADALAQKLAVGDPVDTHEVMLAMQKASLALQLTIQVRNKVIEAYQEIMRMQV